MQLSQTQLTTINNTNYLATSDRYVQIPTNKALHQHCAELIL